jgi:adenine C2-methylase RlmN of 23S rRNA A2503 and tRNA A37
MEPRRNTTMSPPCSNTTPQCVDFVMPHRRATVRRNRGTDIDAACGQLAAGQPVAVGRKAAAPADVATD